MTAKGNMVPELVEGYKTKTSSLAAHFAQRSGSERECAFFLPSTSSGTELDLISNHLKLRPPILLPSFWSIVIRYRLRFSHAGIGQP